MTTVNQYIEEVRNLVAANNLPKAMEKLRAMLQNTPTLNEVLIQQSRYADTLKQIRAGTISFEDAGRAKA